jgi:hypothetical protein
MEEIDQWVIRPGYVDLAKEEWHWAKQPSGSISLPDFIQLRAKGEAKTINGHVYLKKPGPGLELVELFKARIKAAMTQSLYGGDPVDHKGGLAALFSKPKRKKK